MNRGMSFNFKSKDNYINDSISLSIIASIDNKYSNKKLIKKLDKYILDVFNNLTFNEYSLFLIFVGINESAPLLIKALNKLRDDKYENMIIIAVSSKYNETKKFSKKIRKELEYYLDYVDEYISIKKEYSDYMQQREEYSDLAYNLLPSIIDSFISKTGVLKFLIKNTSHSINIWDGTKNTLLNPNEFKKCVIEDKTHKTRFLDLRK